MGIRTLSYYKDFYALLVQSIKSCNKNVPIISGGPHPTIAFEEVLKNTDTQVVVLGEGEITMSEIIKKMLENNGRPLTNEQLKQIDGIAFLE